VSTTVELFEHQTIRIGEPLHAIDGREVRLRERHFDDLVRFNDANDGRFFTVGHRRISLTAYVGYVEVGDLALEILPKADRARAQRGEIAAWRDGLLEMLAVATGIRLESPSRASQRTGRSSLIELIAARFLDELGVLLHQGLAKGYQDDEQNGPTFRGRLLVTEHLRANIARADRFHVRTQEYDRDVALNRILGAALDELCGLALSATCAARAAACRTEFPDVAGARPTAEAFDRIRLGRATMRYQTALILARLVLEHSAPQLRAGSSRVFALLFDMNMLWERYVAALFRRAAGTALDVSTQERHSFWVGPAHRRGVRPDVVVRSRATGEVVLIADTKWKVLQDGPPADGDLQQMFVYNELLHCSRALLVYPSVGAVEGTRGIYAGRDHGCEALHLMPVVGSTWAASRMRETVATLFAEVVAGSAAQPRSPTP
jgi:5-methylcytosine-specific restriction enzyme subunit McrC